MKAVLRVLGTWLLGLALVLIIMDGTKSLAANALVVTPLDTLWGGLHAQSFAALQAWIATYLAPWRGDVLAYWLLGLPGFIVTGVLGLLLLIAGREKRARRYIETV